AFAGIDLFRLRLLCVVRLGLWFCPCWFFLRIVANSAVLGLYRLFLHPLQVLGVLKPRAANLPLCDCQVTVFAKQQHLARLAGFRVSVPRHPSAALIYQRFHMLRHRRFTATKRLNLLQVSPCGASAAVCQRRHKPRDIRRSCLGLLYRLRNRRRRRFLLRYSLFSVWCRHWVRRSLYPRLCLFRFFRASHDIWNPFSLRFSSSRFHTICSCFLGHDGRALSVTRPFLSTIRSSLICFSSWFCTHSIGIIRVRLTL